MFASKKAELRQLRSALDSQARFMDNEQANNHEVEARIEHMERQVHKLKDAFAHEQQALSDAADEVEIMRNTLTKTGGELVSEEEVNGHARLIYGMHSHWFCVKLFYIYAFIALLTGDHVSFPDYTACSCL